MPVIVVCPACQKKARVPDSMLGRIVRCPACAATFPASADGPATPPPVPAEEPADESDLFDEPAAPPRPPLPGDPDALRSLRAGVFLQLLAQGLYAGALAVVLIIALASLLTSGPSAKTGPAFGSGPVVTSSTGSSAVVAALAVLAAGLLLGGSAILGLTGGALCTLAPVAHLARGLAIAALALGVLSFFEALNVFRMLGFIYDFNMSGPGFGTRGAFSSFVVPAALGWVLETGRLTVLALFWRSVSFLLRDGTGAALALRLAWAVPAFQGVLLLLGFVFGLAGGLSGLGGAAMTIIGLVAQLGLLVWGVIVAERVWRRLRAAVPPARAG